VTRNKKEKNDGIKAPVARSATTVSACMIVKNEQDCLERCLESVRDHVDEIIIVDTGSTDRTVEIAKSYGARIYHHPWENDFSKHRNQSLSYATGDWIFQLDADEELFAEDGHKIRETAGQGSADYYNCLFYDMKKDGSTHGVFNLIRLFKNHMGMQYTRKVHNQLMTNGAGAYSSIRIRHYGYDLSEEKMEAKHIRTTVLLKEMIAADPEDAYSLYQLSSSYSMHREFGKAVEYGEKALAIMRGSKLKNGFFMTVFYTVAQGYYALGNHVDAERVCREALNFYPMHPDICHLLADICFRKKSADQYLSAAYRFLDIWNEFKKNPSLIGSSYFHSFSKRHEIFFGLACVHFIKKDYATADQYFLKSFEDSGRLAEKAESICRFYIGKQMTDKAMQWLAIAREAGLRSGKKALLPADSL
jgi:glycosyltransferase involved in cell wall biosynthesis